MTVPVTFKRRTINIGRRTAGRACLALTAPLPALIPSSSQRGGQFLLDQLFDKAPDPIADSRLDRV